MPLNLQKGNSNMYSDINATWNGVRGKCEHECSYCSTLGNKKPVIQAKYSGKPELVEKELKTNLGSGNFIFVQNMSDLFADDVDYEIIAAILEHCQKFPNNNYLYQSKNPERFMPFLEEKLFPPSFVLDTTLETDCYSQALMEDSSFDVSHAPSPTLRWKAMKKIRIQYPRLPLRVTVEPIMRFDLDKLSSRIIDTLPEYVYIGADSNLRCECGHEFRFRKTKYFRPECPKCHNNDLTNSDGLKEPKWSEIVALIEVLLKRGLRVVKKTNLDRLIE